MMNTPMHDGDPGLLPQTPLAREMLALVIRTETPSIANHSIQSFLYARLVGAYRGLVAERDYDPELLFFACVLHDIALTKDVNSGHSFEIDGADFAAELLTRRGLGPAQVDTVWQAIALNTSVGIGERRGAVQALTLAGVTAELGVDTTFMPDATASAIHSAYLASGWTPPWRRAREGPRTALRALQGRGDPITGSIGIEGILQAAPRAR